MKVLVTMFGEVWSNEFFDTPEDALKALREEGYEPDAPDFKFYGLIEGTYVPPSTPEAIIFPGDSKIREV